MGALIFCAGIASVKPSCLDFDQLVQKSVVVIVSFTLCLLHERASGLFLHYRNGRKTPEFIRGDIISPYCVDLGNSIRYIAFITQVLANASPAGINSDDSVRPACVIASGGLQRIQYENPKSIQVQVATEQNPRSSLVKNGWFLSFRLEQVVGDPECSIKAWPASDALG